MRASARGEGANDKYDWHQSLYSPQQAIPCCICSSAAALAEQYSSSLWLKCSVGKTAQRSIDWQLPEEENRSFVASLKLESARKQYPASLRAPEQEKQGSLSLGVEPETAVLVVKRRCSLQTPTLQNSCLSVTWENWDF